MKKTVIILSVLALFAAVSCNKAESPEQTAEGQPVTLRVGLAPETRMSHEYGPVGSGNGIKTAWDENDYVYVRFTKDGTTYLEQFDIDEESISTDDGKSADFSNPSSLLEGNTFTVIYVTEAYRTVSGTDLTFDLSDQDGTLDNLPEYLVAEVTDGGLNGVSLSSQLTYFHFVFSQQISSATSASITSVVINATDSQGTEKPGFYSANNATTAGNISFTPSADVLSFRSVSGFGTKYYVDFDIYAAVFMGTQATNYRVTLDGDFSLPTPGLPGFGSGGDQSASALYYVWNTSKTYAAGRTYKVTGTLSH